MAGAGFKTFTVGEVLTASDVNSYLMQQAVMAFASSGARGSAIGTATEGMLSYLADTDAVEVYDGSAWTALGGGGFTAATAITATDASWTVPTLADPVVRVTVVGGGGGGGGGSVNGGASFLYGGDGGAGGTSSFASSAGTATASGGNGGVGGGQITPAVSTTGFAASNEGQGGNLFNVGAAESREGEDGRGGAVTVAYLNLTGVSTANVTVGAGGAAGTAQGSGAGAGGAGGNGVVIFEYRAG